MQVQHQPLGGNHLKISVSLEPSDYLPQVEAEIKALSKKIVVHGFRPGRVPPGVTRKLYGNAVLAEALNRLVSEQVNNFLRDQKLNTFGEPLPLSALQNSPDLEAPQAYVFDFEVGLYPEITLPEPTAAHFVRWRLEVTEEMLDREVDRLRRRFGHRQHPQMAEGGDALVATFEEVDEQDNPVPGGIQSLASFGLQRIKDADIAARLSAAGIGNAVTVNLRQAFGDDKEFLLHHVLNLDHDREEALDKKFRITLNDIIRVEKAELNQNFFDRMFGEGRINSEEQMRALLRAEMAADFERSAQARLHADIRNYLIDHTGMQLPEAYLRRLLDERREAEEPPLNDERFAAALRQIKWEFIASALAGQQQLEVTDEEIADEARQEVLHYFGVTADYFASDPARLQQLAASVTAKPENRRRLHTRCLHRKVLDWFAGQAQITEQTTSEEEFFYH